MMTDARTITFDVPGRAMPKQRPRMGKGGHVYTPRQTVVYEEGLAWCALSSGLRLKAGDRVRVTAVFHLCPVSGDGDNRLKAALDGLQRAFPDWNDKYVIEGSFRQVAVEKKQAECAVITVEVVE